MTSAAARDVPLVRDQQVAPLAPPQQAMQIESGFQMWTPSAPPAEAHHRIYGSEFSQILEVDVLPGQSVTAEPGTMLFMTPGMGMGADIGGCGQGCKRSCCAGESFFRLHLVNQGQSVERVGLTPSFPARIVPIDLNQHSGLVMNSGAFLGATGADWRIELQRVAGVGICCCAGQGLFLNRLHGSGTVFLNAGGSVMTNTLAEGEEMIIDRHSLLAMQSTVRLGIRRAGGCMVCCCAGQGLFNTVLTGPGWVMVHSMGLSKLRSSIGRASGSNGANGGAAAGGGV